MTDRYRRLSDGVILTEEELEAVVLARLNELTADDIAAYTDYSGVGIEEMSLQEWLLESEEYERIEED